MCKISRDSVAAQVPICTYRERVGKNEASRFPTGASFSIVRGLMRAKS